MATKQTKLSKMQKRVLAFIGLRRRPYWGVDRGGIEHAIYGSDATASNKRSLWRCLNRLKNQARVRVPRREHGVAM